LLVYSLIFKVNIVSFFDTGAIFVPLGTAIGRLGCFLGGCCFGRPTEGAFGIVYQHEHAFSGEAVLPAQLFEFGYCLIIFAVMVYLSRKSRPRGLLSLVYAMSYSLCRFINEFFRGDETRGYIGALSTSQFISVVIFALCTLALAYSFYDKKRKQEVKSYEG
jgi:phosphatidylglycerol:prolipoprotein diacylglycerol transferase